jgi:DNA repair exonuclease SbcCD ATPase subunit
MAASKGEQAMNLHLKEIESLSNSLREREKHVTELENRLRALWDKLEGERKHYMEQIRRLEEAGDAMAKDFAHFWTDRNSVRDWPKAKEAKP